MRFFFVDLNSLRECLPSIGLLRTVSCFIFFPPNFAHVVAFDPLSRNLDQVLNFSKAIALIDIHCWCCLTIRWWNTRFNPFSFFFFCSSCDWSLFYGTGIASLFRFSMNMIYLNLFSSCLYGFFIIIPWLADRPAAWVNDTSKNYKVLHFDRTAFLSFFAIRCVSHSFRLSSIKFFENRFFFISFRIDFLFCMVLVWIYID